MIDHVLVTGASSGIGQAIALRLAAKKIPLLLVGRPDSTGRTRRLIENLGGEAEVFPCDLEDYARIQKELPLFINARPTARWGVVLAAAVLDSTERSGALSDYERVFRVNVVGNLAVLEGCLPAMTSVNFGRVVFFAGGGAAYAYPIFPAYGLSKVSTVRLVENLATVYPRSSGLSFVCLSPGAVDTPMLAKVVAAGGEVKTKTSVEEPIGFVESYLASTSTALSGRYIHVRDDWRAVLDGARDLARDEFFLRRLS
jgi:NAD(P)-dependent dehydrogenase (short-subunit alcohol dehydrogenase family)